MSLTEFETLDINGKADYLWNYQPLDERREAEHTILLYSLPKFYAEVHYHWGDNRIVEVKAFTQLAQLTPYMKK